MTKGNNMLQIDTGKNNNNVKVYCYNERIEQNKKVKIESCYRLE